MALTGSTIASTYLKLLRANSDTMGADATASYIQDSADTDSALSISTTRVGIGTAAPQQPIHIHQSDAGSTSYIQFTQDGTGATGGDGSLIGVNASENLLIYNAEATDLIFYTTAAERMRIDSGGNVGIGDTDPSEAKLSITGVQAGDFGIKIDQDQNQNALLIDSESTTEHILKIDAPILTTHAAIRVADADALTSGALLYLETGSTALATTVNGGLVHIHHTGDSDTNVNNLLLIENDDAGSTGTTALKIQQDSTGPAISATGGIVEEGGALKENLLTNSGFDVWSNSGDLYTTAGDAVGDATVEDATDLIDNGNMGTTAGGDPSVPTGWTNYNAEAGEVAVTGGALVINADATSEGVYTNAFTTVAGKLYKFTASLTRTSGTLAVVIKDGDNSNNLSVAYLTATDTTYSVVYEDPTGGSSGRIYIMASGGAANWSIDKVQLHEVTPGCVAADALAMDGWAKDATLDIWRQHNDGGTLTHDGSFYSLKMTPSAQHDYILFPNGISHNAEWYQRFAGRTVTFGAWLKSSTASDLYLRMTDGDGYTDSSTHTGGGGWEWIEVTKAVSASATQFTLIPSMKAGSPGTAYISQPMLVFGSSIGEGNYTRPQGEIVHLEKTVSSTLLNATHSDVNATTLNLEADTNGKIPKGAKSITFTGWLRDAASYATADGVYFSLAPNTTKGTVLMSCAGIVNDAVTYYGVNQVDCSSDGDLSYTINASGSDTLDARVHFKSVELR